MLELSPSSGKRLHFSHPGSKEGSCGRENQPVWGCMALQGLLIHQKLAGLPRQVRGCEEEEGRIGPSHRCASKERKHFRKHNITRKQGRRPQGS